MRRVTIAVALSLLLAACSGSGGTDDGGPTVLGAGDIVVDVEEVATPVPTAAPEPAVDETAAEDTDSADTPDEASTEDADGAEGDSAEDVDDIPLNETEDSFVEQAEGLFNTIDDFTECLANAGFEFLGVPEAGMAEDDPRGDPTYVQALTTCAAETNIVAAFESTDFSSEGLSPEDIEARNAGYVYFEACLTTRGWNIGEAQPDENGMLQLPDTFDPPAGETLVGTDDLRECLAEANQSVEADLAAES